MVLRLLGVAASPFRARAPGTRASGAAALGSVVGALSL